MLKETIHSKNIVENIEDMNDIKNAPVVKMIDHLFRNSVEMRASDIHIEPYEHEIRIRYRIDGELQTVNILGEESLAPLVTRIKILAGLNIAEKRVPQDGRIITIVTIEDPVEYTLNGINQVNVNTKAGMSFASGLRSILRQDPDIVMIGEVRDDETAKIATKAAITGHLVLTTLHTNDAPSSVTRLIDMGIESYLVATFIAGVISQRLVKKICYHCKESYEASEYERNILKIEKDKLLTLHKGSGCGYCNNTAYLGRSGVYEIMEITREHRDAINTTRDPNVLMDISIKNGMSTLGKECEKLVLQGVTTVNELANITLLTDI